MFTGREWLADLQLYDYRHRLYNPDNGRFLQTDPTGFDAGDMNLFRYCGDDPVDQSDPMGLDFTKTTDKPIETPELVDKEGAKMFGRSTYSMVATITVRPDENGTFSLQIKKYDVRLERREIATTDNGRPRTPEAIEATKTLHEPNHDKHMKALDKRMQNKVIKTGLKSAPTQERLDKEVNKLGERFDSFNKREQETCKKGQGEWKQIIDKEKAK